MGWDDEQDDGLGKGVRKRQRQYLDRESMKGCVCECVQAAAANQKKNRVKGKRQANLKSRSLCESTAPIRKTHESGVGDSAIPIYDGATLTWAPLFFYFPRTASSTFSHALCVSLLTFLFWLQTAELSSSAPCPHTPPFQHPPCPLSQTLSCEE